MKRAPLVATLLSLPLFLGVWQLAAASHLVNPLLFPPPVRVVEALYRYLGSREGWSDIGWTLRHSQSTKPSARVSRDNGRTHAYGCEPAQYTQRPVGAKVAH